MRDMTEPLDPYEDQGDYDWDYDEADDRGPRPKILWGRVISMVVFMLIAFLVGRVSKSGGVDQATYDAVVDEQQSLEEENTQLEQRVADLEAAVTNAETDTGTDGEDTETDTGTDGGDGESDVAAGTAYTVESGDTLNAIVKKHYDCLTVENADGASADLVDGVLDAETQQPIDPNAAISVGQELILPPTPPGYDCP
jgi:nucleoid-associated protein YgaU